MASTQKRWLTQPKSKLSKVDLAKVLAKDEAWALLPEETRQDLYDMLPPPLEGEPPHDKDVHPFHTHLKPYIENEIRRWQDDLREGKEAKSWRNQAILAGKARSEGKWDAYQQAKKEQDWGVPRSTVAADKKDDSSQSKDEVSPAKEGVAE